MQKVNLETWTHSDTYLLFNEKDLPFYSVTSQVDVTRLLRKAEENSFSFFAICLHEILTAANAIEAFRYRNLADGSPVLFQRVSASYLIERPNGTLLALRVPPISDIEQFINEMGEQKRCALETDSTSFGSKNERDVVFVSCVPWMTFTGASHPCDMGKKYDSIPRINIGKYTKHSDGTVTMPVNIHVHHGFVYGKHLAEFFNFLDKGE